MQPDNADCTWTIQCDTGDVTLSFQSFETEGGWDYVYVDGATYDGSSTPGDITGSSSMVIRFTSDGSVGADGFAATATCPDCVGCDTGQTISDDPCQAPVVHHGSSSISFTGGYESSSDCNWVVECESVDGAAPARGSGSGTVLDRGALVSPPSLPRHRCRW